MKKVWTKDEGGSEDRPERGRVGGRVLDLWVAEREDEEPRGFSWEGERRNAGGGGNAALSGPVAVATSWKLPKSLQMAASTITAIIVNDDTEREPLAGSRLQHVFYQPYNCAKLMTKTPELV